MDVVYQGFASGDLDEDVAGVRKLVQDGHKLGICQSFSKNMGLYGKCVCILNYTSLTQLYQESVLEQPLSCVLMKRRGKQLSLK